MVRGGGGEGEVDNLFPFSDDNEPDSAHAM